MTPPFVTIPSCGLVPLYVTVVVPPFPMKLSVSEPTPSKLTIAGSVPPGTLSGTVAPPPGPLKLPTAAVSSSVIVMSPGVNVTRPSSAAPLGVIVTPSPDSTMRSDVGTKFTLPSVVPFPESPAKLNTPSVPNVPSVASVPVAGEATRVTVSWFSSVTPAPADSIAVTAWAPSSSSTVWPAAIVTVAELSSVIVKALAVNVT